MPTAMSRHNPDRMFLARLASGQMHIRRSQRQEYILTRLTLQSNACRAICREPMPIDFQLSISLESKLPEPEILLAVG